MPLLRKDLKLGFAAAAVLLALATGYGLVLALTGGPDDDRVAAADPIGDPIDAIAVTPTAPDPDSPPAAPLRLAAVGEVGEDAWGQEFGDPIVTTIPTSPVTSVEESAEAAPTVPDLNNDPLFATPTPADPEPLPVEPPAATTSAGITLTHVVRPGDNPSSIADEYYGDPNRFAAILAANPGLDARRMRVGQTLNIPPADVAAAPAPAESGGSHTVRPGDTLTKIAVDRLGRSNLWESIYALNRDAIGPDPAALKVGQVLKLPQ